VEELLCLIDRPIDSYMLANSDDEHPVYVPNVPRSWRLFFSAFEAASLP
jgi:hypothetical protein